MEIGWLSLRVPEFFDWRINPGTTAVCCLLDGRICLQVYNMCDPDTAFFSEQPDEHLPLPSEAALRKALHRAGKDLQAARAHETWVKYSATIYRGMNDLTVVQ